MISKTVFLLLFSATVFAQENDSLQVQEKKIFKFEETFSMYYVVANQSGNHTLAKDYSNRFGFGSRLTLFSLAKFNLGAGGEYVTYSVSNQSNAGNFNKGTYKNFFFLVNYPIQVAPRFTLTPVAAIGALQFTQRQRGIRHSHQEGINYRIGVSADYEVAPEMDLFLGLEFIDTRFNLNANPEIFDYYGKSKNLQMSIGIRFKTAKKKAK